jgi:hypothetical protein
MNKIFIKIQRRGKQCARQIRRICDSFRNKFLLRITVHKFLNTMTEKFVRNESHLLLICRTFCFPHLICIFYFLNKFWLKPMLVCPCWANVDIKHATTTTYAFNSCFGSIGKIEENLLYYNLLFGCFFTGLFKQKDIYIYIYI